jgi:hypothetical protein
MIYCMVGWNFVSCLVWQPISQTSNGRSGSSRMCSQYRAVNLAWEARERTEADLEEPGLSRVVPGYHF